MGGGECRRKEEGRGHRWMAANPGKIDILRILDLVGEGLQASCLLLRPGQPREWDCADEETEAQRPVPGSPTHVPRRAGAGVRGRRLPPSSPRERGVGVSGRGSLL